jgi:hypothetical protein
MLVFGLLHCRQHTAIRELKHLRRTYAMQQAAWHSCGRLLCSEPHARPLRTAQASVPSTASELPACKPALCAGRAAAPKPPATPPPGPQKLGTPRGGASESSSGDDESAARPSDAERVTDAADWSADAQWTPVKAGEVSVPPLSETMTRCYQNACCV